MNQDNKKAAPGEGAARINLTQPQHISEGANVKFPLIMTCVTTNGQFPGQAELEGNVASLRNHVAPPSTQNQVLLALQADAAAVGATPSPYTTRAWGELSRMLLPPLEYFWGQAFALGSNGILFGQGGLGKSRLALNLVRNQVIGLPFAGLATGNRPLRQLMMGSENSIHRLQHDVRKMSAGLTSEQLTMLDTHIRLATLENPEDPFITLGDMANVIRWRVTLEAFKPEVLWVDPFGDLLDGEANSDEDVRGTLRTLNRLLREVCPNAACVILAHSRTGAKNIAQAVGFDAANFGKGSKALYSAARSVWNLAPGNESEDPPVVLFHAKNNNGPRHPPMAVRLDPKSMLYELVEGFDFDAWQAIVSARASGKGKGRTTPARPLEEYRAAVLLLVQEGPLPAGILEAKIKQCTGVSDRTVRAILQEVVHAGVLKKSARVKERDGHVLYGLPADVDKIMRPELNFDAVVPLGSVRSQTDQPNQTDQQRLEVGLRATSLRERKPTKPTPHKRTKRSRK